MTVAHTSHRTPGVRCPGCEAALARIEGRVEVSPSTDPQAWKTSDSHGEELAAVEPPPVEIGLGKLENDLQVFAFWVGALFLAGGLLVSLLGPWAGVVLWWAKVGAVVGAYLLGAALFFLSPFLMVYLACRVGREVLPG